MSELFAAVGMFTVVLVIPFVGLLVVNGLIDYKTRVLKKVEILGEFLQWRREKRLGLGKDESK